MKHSITKKTLRHLRTLHKHSTPGTWVVVPDSRPDIKAQIADPLRVVTDTNGGFWNEGEIIKWVGKGFQWWRDWNDQLNLDIHVAEFSKYNRAGHDAELIAELHNHADEILRLAGVGLDAELA